MFNEIKKNFGFGCMRLPLKGEAIDYDVFCNMIDYFLSKGFNYFDTAHGYHEGLSEKAVRACLVDRYPRDKYVLTDKLSHPYFKSEEEVRPFFESQLEICGVDYFDFYLMHAQTKDVFAHFKKCRAYEQALEFKKEGKIKHMGISFHDTAEVLDEILTQYPQVEVVQIQLNYVDFDDPAVQSRRCYEVCKKHNKPVIVMEPVRGGNLVNLPDSAKKIFDSVGSGSYASYAIRYAAGFEDVFMVLSGMSNMQQMEDNLSYMSNFKPLDESERDAVERVCKVFKDMKLIPCTACRYCVEGCPKKISIPDLFACLNTKKNYNDWNADYYYDIHTDGKGKAKDCIACGRCEGVCPQHLNIRALLKDVAAQFDVPRVRED